ncbi:MAG: uncharacterized protein K0S45_2471 [Nitrospira sp.]|nr:uncharacterized protein [Nitrospira sp.]
MIEMDVSRCRSLDRLFTTRPLPGTVILDNSHEFAGTSLDACAARHGVHAFIQPGIAKAEALGTLNIGRSARSYADRLRGFRCRKPCRRNNAGIDTRG